MRFPLAALLVVLALAPGSAAPQLTPPTTDPLAPTGPGTAARPPSVPPSDPEAARKPTEQDRPERPEPPPKPLPRGAILEEVVGTIRDVDRTTHRVAIDTPAGRITLTVDRNTMVYLPSGLGTPLDLTAGTQVRAGRNADHLAYWVQVRPPSARSASSIPGQGTGPGGGSGPPPAETPTGTTGTTAANPAGPAASETAPPSTAPGAPGL